jgi:hypothetical protein
VKHRLAFAIRTALTVTGLTFLAGCGQVGGPQHAGQPTAQAQLMDHMLVAINQIRAFSYGSGDQASAQAAADDLVNFAGQLPVLFPPGQASVDYVDMSPDRARDAPAALTRTILALQTTVRTGDRDAVGRSLAQTEQDGCGFCHRPR